MLRVCLDRRSGRFSLVLSAVFLGPRHPSRTERCTSCRPPECDRFDQIDVTCFLPVSVFRASFGRLSGLVRRAAIVFLVPFGCSNSAEVGFWFCVMILLAATPLQVRGKPSVARHSQCTRQIRKPPAE